MTLLETLTKKIGDLLSRPGTDISGSITLSGTLTALDTATNPRECKAVTLINNTGADVSATIGGGDEITIPDSGGLTVYVQSLGQVKVSGSGTLGYTFTI